MPVEIPMTRGFVALVDEADAPLVSLLTWWPSGPRAGSLTIYASTTAKTRPKTVKMHNVIMHPPAGCVVDHINHNGLDNRRCNLRLCTPRQNQQHRRSSNKHGFNGVCFVANRARFYGRITLPGGRQIYTRGYQAAEDAARAWDDLAILHYGEFAVLNFPSAA